MNLKAIGTAIVALLFFLAALVWILQFDDYQACLNNDKISDSECLTAYLMLSPPIQEAQEISDACNQSDAACLARVGQKAIEEKLTE